MLPAGAGPVFATSDEMTPGALIIAGALMGVQVRIGCAAPTFVDRGMMIIAIVENRTLTIVARTFAANLATKD
ncbi:MAG: hypothetical protein E5V66_31620 [Mesorhizobium sp.]|uniref:hypothetical protein n=1 Tax=unclassified Mesorhizobium TaxID=325217 RepID=UPI000FCB2D92|nr:MULTISPECIES: hypothetical protein [unclassified Mesorhizobium]RUW76276.1 hypothetical protein EOA29_28005 [Mesorhizobium sp. M1E.F.Ca.ET.063.01.1.1]TIW07287.1 MAG: hypothetical protein E5V66_31620 [Mesorhizobium sp.]